MSQGSEMVELAIPEAIAKFGGQITDVDSHEMMPTKVWEENFGAEVESLIQAYEKSIFARPENPNSQYVPEYQGDNLEITADSIWKIKGGRAPGATDMSRRLEVLDLMGISRQLVFPTSVGLMAAMLRTGYGNNLFKPATDLDVHEYSKELFRVHNDWAVRVQSVSSRLRPVAVVQADDVGGVCEVAEDLIRRGIRAFWFLSGELLGGRSPAHTDLDPLWEVMARNDVVATVHVGGEGGLLKTEEWSNAPWFENYKKALEIEADPWHMSIMHLAAQNYVATMVVGGVFERFPSLRFGAIETAAHWIGPLASQLDTSYENGHILVRNQRNTVLPRAPSYYINRNVRVSVFDFEPIDLYIKRFGLEDVYCFASDYPHVEGGYAPMDRFVEKLQPLGLETMEKFFVKNGQWLLP